MPPRVKRCFVDGPYGQVHCRVAAARDRQLAPVVCLHMSPKSSRSFNQVLPFLANRRLALAPDNPGHGESDLPPTEPPVTIEDYARSAWAAIDALCDPPVHLLGHHTGAMVAAEAAAQREGDVLSIVSFSAPLYTAEEQAALDEAFQPIPIDETGTRFQLMWQRVIDHRGPGMTLEMAAESFAENLRAGDHYEWGHRAAFAYAPTYRKRLGELDQPILVINPADDCFEPSQRADAIMKNGRRIDVPNWGHGLFSAYPRRVATLVLEFLEEHDQEQHKDDPGRRAQST